MNKLLLIILLLSSCSREQADYSWFEDNWISDAESSIAINPDYSELNDNQLETIREMYGRITWSIAESTMTFRDDRYNQLVEFSAEFDVEPISAERFRMRMENELRIIWKTGTGFCTELDPEHLIAVGIASEGVGLECFEPSGT